MRCFRLAGAVTYVATPLLVAGIVAWQHVPRWVSGGTREASPQAAEDSPASALSAGEWDLACKEFEAITDSTLECNAEEMPAYWRLLKWTVQHSVSDLQHRSGSRVPYGDLVNMPSRLRGRLVQVDLQVCRILSYDAPGNGLGIKKLYEVWGWSEDSRGSLYVVVTPELPAGMKTGEVVRGQATLYGYFCKIQGYLAVGSAPRSLPSAAPLLIGRMVRYQAPVTVIAKPAEVMRAGVGLLLAVSFVGLISGRPLFRRRQETRFAEPGPSNIGHLEAWLDREGGSGVAADAKGPG